MLCIQLLIRSLNIVLKALILHLGSLIGLSSKKKWNKKKRKKYRLGSTVGNEKGANKRQLVPMTTSSTDEKISLSKEPSRYNPESNNDLKLLRQNTHKLIAQVRRPDYLLQD